MSDGGQMSVRHRFARFRRPRRALLTQKREFGFDERRCTERLVCSLPVFRCRSEREVDVMWHEPVGWCARRVDLIAGPPIRLRAGDHLRPYGILFDVPQTREPIAFIAYGQAAIAPAPERSDPRVFSIEMFRI